MTVLGECFWKDALFKMSFVPCGGFTCLNSICVSLYIPSSCWEVYEPSIERGLHLESHAHHGFTHMWQKGAADALCRKKLSFWKILKIEESVFEDGNVQRGQAASPELWLPRKAVVSTLTATPQPWVLQWILDVTASNSCCLSDWMLLLLLPLCSHYLFFASLDHILSPRSSASHWLSMQ